MAVDSCMISRVMQGGSGSLASADAAFPPGSTVQFRTSLGGHITGQVICFDAPLKVLAIKDMSSGRPVMRTFNLALISEIKDTTGQTSDALDLPGSSSLNSAQINDRSNMAEERKRAEMMEVDVSVEGQKAFIMLRRVLNEVRWRGADIEVLKLVTVKAPYSPDNVEPKQNDEKCHAAVTQVRKLLAKPFTGERKLTACCREAAPSDPE